MFGTRKDVLLKAPLVGLVAIVLIPASLHGSKDSVQQWEGDEEDPQGDEIGGEKLADDLSQRGVSTRR